MAGHTEAARPFNVRLPEWARDFVELRSSETGTTKTQVILDALSCLQAGQVQALMREGYEEMRELNRQMAEQDLAAGTDSLPEW